MNNNNNSKINCEWSSPHRILALLSETLSKDKVESYLLGRTPAQLFLLMLASIVLTISFHCFNQSIKTRKSRNAHNIHQSRPEHSPMPAPIKSYERYSMDSSIKFKKPNDQHTWNSDQNRTKAQPIHKTAKKSDKSGSIRIIIKNK